MLAKLWAGTFAVPYQAKALWNTFPSVPQLVEHRADPLKNKNGKLISYDGMLEDVLDLLPGYSTNRANHALESIDIDVHLAAHFSHDPVGFQILYDELQFLPGLAERNAVSKYASPNGLRKQAKDELNQRCFIVGGRSPRHCRTHF